MNEQIVSGIEGFVYTAVTPLVHLGKVALNTVEAINTLLTNPVE